MTELPAPRASLTTVAAPPIGLVGSGLLHTALADALGARCRLVEPEDAAGCAAVAVLGDADDTSAYPAVRRAVAEHATAWLPVRVDGPWVLIGPSVRPSAQGCPTCAERRRGANRPDGKARELLRTEHGATPAGRPSALVTPLTAHTVATVVADELDRLLRDPSTARTNGALLRLCLTSAAVSRHPLLPDPLCPDCGHLPPDTADAAVIRAHRLPKPRPNTFRTCQLLDREEELLRLYVDAETGVVASIDSSSAHGSPTAVARLSPARAAHDSNHGYGRTRDFRSARLTALTEALERMAGPHPRGRRLTVRAAYADIADQALDPRTLGLYPDDWYDQPGFRFARFDVGRGTSWVWGYSFSRGAPVLVPATYAYYGHRPRTDPGFTYECSNGCALGSSLPEAILYGLLEIAERDAFLMTWYAQLPVPRIDLASAHDPRIPLAVELLRQQHGYQAFAFATTVEQRVPAFWLMAVDPDSGPDRPRLYCAAAAHLHPERALLGALHELVAGVASLTGRYDAQRAEDLFHTSDLVREMDDHALLYGLPAAQPRLAFLATDGPARPLSDFAGLWAWPQHHDLSDDLGELVSRYLACGLDVIAVDTTSPEQRAGGFASAKVIVPGTLSMTFGHRYRRSHGLPRLSTVPRLLGYRDADLPAEDINPFPHPFP
ncbi:TOMM precursor leader peptide-binding protein [Streptomyces sp. NPDC057743]|uniref:TOMM precursor leader peptide-binding protein n=1 Tax=Streptomyces sp. NPDC057743 TaxID=3346236 RepID=UPI003683E1C9